LALHLAEMKNITWICDGEATDRFMCNESK